MFYFISWENEFRDKPFISAPLTHDKAMDLARSMYNKVAERIIYNLNVIDPNGKDITAEYLEIGKNAKPKGYHHNSNYHNSSRHNQ